MRKAGGRGTTGRQYPAAWYPDPVDPGHLQRWNGRRWTGERRPVPSWLATVRLAPGPPRRRRAGWLWAASAACVLAALVVLGVESPAPPAADRIRGQAFVTGAGQACQRVAHKAPEAATAADIRALAVEWTGLVRQLRRLPVTTEDRPVVDRWLEAWERWVDAGRRYADALEAGDEAAANRISETSEPDKAVMDRIAVASGLSDCVVG